MINYKWNKPAPVQDYGYGDPECERCEDYVLWKMEEQGCNVRDCPHKDIRSTMKKKQRNAEYYDRSVHKI